MHRSARLIRTPLMLLLVPMLLAANCRKKPPESEDDAIVDNNAAQDIDNELGVVSVSPSSVAAGKTTNVTVRGAGFDGTPRVFVGSEPATSVTASSSRSLSVSLPAMEAGVYDVEVVNPNGDSATLRQGLQVTTETPSCAELVVYFGLDQAALSSEATATLSRELDCLKASSARIRIQGHADERGTTDYNLALGDRRGNAVTSWLAGRGIQRTRMDTVSYGEERPADPGHDERAWQRNRRVEVLLAR